MDKYKVMKILVNRAIKDDSTIIEAGLKIGISKNNVLDYVNNFVGGYNESYYKDKELCSTIFANYIIEHHATVTDTAIAFDLPVYALLNSLEKLSIDNIELYQQYQSCVKIDKSVKKLITDTADYIIEYKVPLSEIAIIFKIPLSTLRLNFFKYLPVIDSIKCEEVRKVLKSPGCISSDKKKLIYSYVNYVIENKVSCQEAAAHFKISYRAFLRHIEKLKYFDLNKYILFQYKRKVYKHKEKSLC